MLINMFPIHLNMDFSKIGSNIFIAVISALVVTFFTFITIGINNDAQNIGEIPGFRSRIESLERDRENFKEAIDELNRITLNLYTVSEEQRVKVDRNKVDLQNIRDFLKKKYLIPERAIQFKKML